ncbi:MAG: response regulator transcription factor [Bdellovibrionota bacterium]|nr:MAG: response regulator transcription factor [Bdellovibrionota bacterium]
MVSILIVDDEELIRRGLSDWIATLPDVEMVVEAATGDECLTALERDFVNVALVDILLPGISGIELVARIREQYPSIKCVMLSGNVVPEAVCDAFQAGAVGFLSKFTSPTELQLAMQEVMKGRWYLSPLLTRSVIEKVLAFRSSAAVTSSGNTVPMEQKERELLKLLAEGKTLSEIARALGVSPRTVERMKSKLEQKLKADTFADLVRCALKMGLVPP